MCLHTQRPERLLRWQHFTVIWKSGDWVLHNAGKMHTPKHSRQFFLALILTYPSCVWSFDETYIGQFSKGQWRRWQETANTKTTPYWINQTPQLFPQQHWSPHSIRWEWRIMPRLVIRTLSLFTIYCTYYLYIHLWKWPFLSLEFHIKH